MQLAAFNARCDIEIGDQVTFAGTIPCEVTNIRCTHYVLTGHVTFEFELSIMPGYWFCRNDFVYPAYLPDGQLSSPEIAEMHRDGTLCESCGTYLGPKTGSARLCSACSAFRQKGDAQYGKA